MSYTLYDFAAEIQDMHENEIDTELQFPALYEKIKNGGLPLMKCIQIYNRIILPPFALTQKAVEKKCNSNNLDYHALNLAAQ